MISALISSIYFAILTTTGMAFGPALHQALPIAGTIADAIYNIPGSLDLGLAIANAINNPVADMIFEFIFC